MARRLAVARRATSALEKIDRALAAARARERRSDPRADRARRYQRPDRQPTSRSRGASRASSRCVPASDYERKVAEARRRGLVYPYEIVRMLTGGSDAAARSVAPPAGASRSTTSTRRASGRARSGRSGPAGQHLRASSSASSRRRRDKIPEGMRRVLVLSDPTRDHGRARRARVRPHRRRASIWPSGSELPVEWMPISSGARIAMDSGTENLDATARVVRRIVTFTAARRRDPPHRARRQRRRAELLGRAGDHAACTRAAC